MCCSLNHESKIGFAVEASRSLIKSLSVSEAFGGGACGGPG